MTEKRFNNAIAYLASLENNPKEKELFLKALNKTMKKEKKKNPNNLFTNIYKK